MASHNPLRTVLAIAVVAMLLAGSARADNPDEAKGATLQLGTVQVKGQRQIMETLQQIKMALKRSESSDRSQRQEVICRIDTDVGTHHQQYLECATNATRDRRREATQSSMYAACESVRGTSCAADQAFGARSSLGMAIGATSDHFLRMPVNGAALQALLAKIPDPSPEVAPVSGTATAPSAATRADP